MVDSSDFVISFLFDIGQELYSHRVQGIAKLKLALKQHSHLVSNIADEVRRVCTARPDSNHILIPINNGLEKLFHFVSVIRGQNASEGMNWSLWRRIRGR